MHFPILFVNSILILKIFLPIFQFLISFLIFILDSLLIIKPTLILILIFMVILVLISRLQDFMVQNIQKNQNIRYQ